MSGSIIPKASPIRVEIVIGDRALRIPVSSNTDSGGSRTRIPGEVEHLFRPEGEHALRRTALLRWLLAVGAAGDASGFRLANPIGRRQGTLRLRIESPCITILWA